MGDLSERAGAALPDTPRNYAIARDLAGFPAHVRRKAARVHHCGICEKMPVGLATVAARLSAAGPPH